MDARPYQTDLLTALHNHWANVGREVCVQLPTGAGKTFSALMIAQQALADGLRVLIIIDQIVLADQWRDSAIAAGVAEGDIGILRGKATANLDAPLVVASAQTIRARRETSATDAWLAGFTVTVIDECHIMRKQHAEAIEVAKDAGNFVAGLTATPEAPGLKELYSDIIAVTAISDLTEQGFLVPCVVKIPAESADYKEALDDVRVVAGEYIKSDLSDAMSLSGLRASAVRVWQREADNRPTLAFCVTKRHAHAIANEFVRAGIKAVALTEENSLPERAEAIARFEAGDITVLCSVMVLAIGFDSPIAEVGLMLRPTKSLSLWIQQSGRLLRPSEGKDHCLLLDLAGNSEQMGHPSDYQPPNALKKKGQKGDGAIVGMPELEACEECFTAFHKSEDICPQCGHKRPEPEPSTQKLIGEGERAVGMKEVARASRLTTAEVLGMCAWITMDKGHMPMSAVYKARDYLKAQGRYLPYIDEEALAQVRPIEPTPELRRFVNNAIAEHRKTKPPTQVVVTEDGVIRTNG